VSFEAPAAFPKIGGFELGKLFPLHVLVVIE
jgi:hypothetical protein